MKLPLAAAVNAWKVRRALPYEQQVRLDKLRIKLDFQAAQPHWQRRVALSIARFATLDCETTGPDMNRDRLISLGAVAVRGRAVRHDDAFEAVVQQAQSSSHDNILIHRIGGQEQLAGQPIAYALMDWIEWCADSVLVAFRAEFDETVLTREVNTALGLPQQAVILDLAALLPALFPGQQNDSLDDWVAHFGLPPIGRHHAIADAYANAQLMLLVLEKAERDGLREVGELIDMERAQRWLGKRH
jgi:DNA polymerase-3 subunit epsilon